VITINTTVSGSPGDQITNTAVVEGGGLVAEPDFTDNVGSVTVTIGQLPHTGAEIARLVAIGFLLLAAGALLLGATRRKEEEAAH
jgi:LPXTG-motif cell wall-anchored protein